MSTAGPNTDNEIVAEFLDDYFAECDEHLTSIRGRLLLLENSVDKPRPERAPLDELFRNYHTLKGISGMVGAREAEQLAHQVESYLRLLRNRQLRVTSDGLDLLIRATKLMERLIAEHRAHSPAGDNSVIIREIESIIAGQSEAVASPPANGSVVPVKAPSTELNEDEEARTVAALESGNRIWRFEFVPLPELIQRGINVNMVRGRLQDIGELIHASPRVNPDGGIAFEFIIASEHEEAAFAPWAEDGLTYSAYEFQPAVPAVVHYEDSATDPSKPEPALAPSNVVRVELSRLDDLMRMVGDLVISRSRLDDNLRKAESNMQASDWRSFQETNLAMERQLRDLREGVMRVRMVPVGGIFEKMKFVVRDLASEYKKSVRLELSGQQTEVDKLLVERMMDPILHLVRNAVSHGLETVAERIAAGKSPEGTIWLRASTVAETVVIEIEDDGKGIDAAAVARRAAAEEMIAPGVEPDSSLLLDLICAPGFSTREHSDRASGRGLGMNVVKNTVVGLGGSLRLKTEAGRGTLFCVQLPLTLAIAEALIVAVGEQRFAVPLSSVREVLEVDLNGVNVMENNEIISHHGGVLPLLRLGRLFRVEQQVRPNSHAFVVGSGASPAAIVVDRILGQREIVVRAINDPLIQVPGIAGATELGDGHIVLILDAASLVRKPEGRQQSVKQQAVAAIDRGER